jgi:hypothetical protein
LSFFTKGIKAQQLVFSIPIKLV